MAYRSITTSEGIRLLNEEVSALGMMELYPERFADHEIIPSAEHFKHIVHKETAYKIALARLEKHGISGSGSKDAFAYMFWYQATTQPERLFETNQLDDKGERNPLYELLAKELKISIDSPEELLYQMRNRYMLKKECVSALAQSSRPDLFERAFISITVEDNYKAKRFGGNALVTDLYFNDSIDSVTDLGVEFQSTLVDYSLAHPAECLGFIERYLQIKLPVDDKLPGEAPQFNKIETESPRINGAVYSRCLANIATANNGECQAQVVEHMQARLSALPEKFKIASELSQQGKAEEYFRLANIYLAVMSYAGIDKPVDLIQNIEKSLSLR